MVASLRLRGTVVLTLLYALVAAALGFALSALLTGGVVRRAKRAGALDLPNERSSHRTPTPRGGGLGFVLTCTALLALLALLDRGGFRLWLALAGAFPVAWGGWLDDRRSLSPRLRLAVQAAAALWTLLCLGGVPVLDWGPSRWDLGLGGTMVAALALLWGTNLFNFMDGIDGFAGIEGASVFLLGGAAFLLRGPVPLGFLCLGLTGALGGFLLWNWPPAQIFMGDVGSGFLGFLFAAVALAGQLGGIPIPFWMVLGTGFFVDATATLLLRVGTGNSPVQPHREHAYQRLARHGLSHRTLSLALGSFNALWGLAALAALVLAPQALMPLWGASWSAALAVWVLARCLPPTTDGTRRV